MSHPVATAMLLEEVQAQLSASNPPGTLTKREVVLGQVVVIDHTLPSGCDTFVSRCFELPETDEELDLTTAIRVYEEVQLRKVRRIRRQTITVTLRRELAEVIEAVGPDETP